MWFVVLLAVAGFLLAGNLTQWDNGLMLCLIGIALGCWFKYTGRNVIGWGLIALCGVSFAALVLLT